jgi:hypothetical protein
MEIIGSDPVYHQIKDSTTLIRSGLEFTTSATGTGLYFDLSCYYYESPPRTTVEALHEFGDITVEGQEQLCLDEITITRRGEHHPALDNVTDDGLSGWSCTVHERIDHFPLYLGVLVTEDVSGLPWILGTRLRP